MNNKTAVALIIVGGLIVIMLFLLLAEEFDPMTRATERANQAAENYDDIIQKLGADIRKLDAEALEFAWGKSAALAFGAAQKIQDQRAAELFNKLLEQELTRTQETNRQAAYNECMRESHSEPRAVDYCKDCSERRDCRPPSH